MVARQLNLTFAITIIFVINDRIGQDLGISIAPVKAESRLTLLILRRLLKSKSQSRGGVKCGQYPGRQRHVCVNDLPKVATWIRSGDRPLRERARQRSTTQATHSIILLISNSITIPLQSLLLLVQFIQHPRTVSIPSCNCNCNCKFQFIKRLLEQTQQRRSRPYEVEPLTNNIVFRRRRNPEGERESSYNLSS